MPFWGISTYGHFNIDQESPYMGIKGSPTSWSVSQSDVRTVGVTDTHTHRQNLEVFILVKHPMGERRLRPKG